MDAVEQLILLLAAVLPLVLLAAWLGVRAGADLRRAWRARVWLPTAGLVLRSEVEESLVRVRTSTGLSTTRLARRYRARVVYQYAAGGAIHRGERLHFGAAFVSSGTGAAERTVARLPLGAAVTVYYNPDDPADAVLERRVGWGTHVLWICTLLVLAAAVGIVAAIFGSIAETQR